ncbi:adenosine deaminase [uncultured Friedmanniella sp.]|uniref:adenosine deaminase n=1 Tax=uncultured Friedmanniella sp. TaxID=335381 RepID=UPI0035CCA77D
MTTPDLDLLRAMPKVSLHDHLDGGVRAATVFEIAGEIGHPLPADSPEALGRWFAESADSGSLVRYLETFDHTVAVMQRPQDIRRVAREFVEDLAADGVVYGETRYAPERLTEGGLTEAQAVEAVRDGIAEGMAACLDRGEPILVHQLLDSMRHEQPTTRIAELALAYRDAGVAGFDIAGPEDGFPAEDWAAAFGLLRRQLMPFTIHAGEAAGVESIRGALACGARRIGHGVRIIGDITMGEDGAAVLGPVATYVRDARITLELCPSSNVQTGAVGSLTEYPFRLLDELGFRVTVNCDNQLMSSTSLSGEYGVLVEHFGYDLAGLRRITVNAAKSAFLPFDQRQSLIAEVILPAWDAVVAAGAGSS